MKKTTIWFCLIVTVFILLADVYFLVKGGSDSTISTIITTYSHKIPAIPFAFGLLCGHFFLGPSQK